MGVRYDNFQRLSPARKRLVRIWQVSGFCTLSDLTIRDGEPILDPRPRVIDHYKFPGQNGPRPEAALEDFTLKTEAREFFECLDRIKDGTVIQLDIQHGLPSRMQVERRV